MGIMEKNMETTVVYLDYIGVSKNAPHIIDPTCPYTTHISYEKYPQNESSYG